MFMQLIQFNPKPKPKKRKAFGEIIKATYIYCRFQIIVFQRREEDRGKVRQNQRISSLHMPHEKH